MTKKTFCDKCLSKIEDGKCSCGVWFQTKDQPFSVTLERAIFAYDHLCEEYQTFTPFSGDHHTGNCIVLFKGDYDLTQKVVEFIKEQNFVPPLENS